MSCAKPSALWEVTVATPYMLQSTVAGAKQKRPEHNHMQEEYVEHNELHNELQHHDIMLLLIMGLPGHYR